MKATINIDTRPMENLFQQLMSKFELVEIRMAFIEQSSIQEYYSIGEVANYFGCSDSKIRSLIKDGNLSTLDLDGLARIHRDEIIRFAKENGKIEDIKANLSLVRKAS